MLDLLGFRPELTEQEVRDEVMTLLLAGHETTAMALTWAVAAIDQAPAVRADLEADGTPIGRHFRRVGQRTRSL